MSSPSPYLCNDISRPYFNALQHTNQRLRNRRPNLQRRQLITTSNELPTRHNQRISPSLKIGFRFLDDPLHSLRRCLRRRDEIFHFHLDNCQLPRCAEPVCEKFQLRGCLGHV